jgi:trans-2,3-dihydro-3-hydroxyanthranilate isomerase
VIKMRRRFVTLDVFTDRPFTGNPLAVVLDSGGLDQRAMQAIAREFNLPETVFVLPPAEPKHTAKLRIFTPAVELPFAGHPTVGTAVLLGRAENARDIVLEENIGPVRCRVETIDSERGRAHFIVPRLPQETGRVAARVDIAAALNAAPADIGFDNFQPARWSAGVPFIFVPMRGLKAIADARPDMSRLDAVFGDGDLGKAYLFCAETADSGHDFHARMFAPGLGIPEDPATGAAAAAFAGFLAATRRLDDGEHMFQLEQGYEMGRPSLIELTLTTRGGALRAATIGGDAVKIGEGTIEA